MSTRRGEPAWGGSDAALSGRTLVVGLGNPLLRDDRVGLEVLDRLQATVGGDGEVVLAQDTHGGLRLMEAMVGFERAIVVDATLQGGAPGTIYELAPNDVPTYHSASPHDASLPVALTLGRALGATLPTDDAIRLIAVEAADVTTFEERCTDAVLAAIPHAVDHVLMLLATSPRWGTPAGTLWAPTVRSGGEELRR